VPDIFLNLYSKGAFGEKRLGYYRIKATDKSLQENSLDWYKFKGFGIGTCLLIFLIMVFNEFLLNNSFFMCTRLWL
jgi:hypothetical protein